MDIRSPYQYEVYNCASRACPPALFIGSSVRGTTRMLSIFHERVLGAHREQIDFRYGQIKSPRGGRRLWRRGRTRAWEILQREANFGRAFRHNSRLKNARQRLSNA